MKTFRGAHHTLPANADNCVEIVKIARKCGLTQSVIAEGSGISPAQLSSFMHNRSIYGKESIQTRLAEYFSQNKEGQLIIDELCEKLDPHNLRKRELEQSLEETNDFAEPLHAFFQIPSESKELKDVHPAFYLCYKRSQRFRSEIDHENRQIVKSILMVRPAAYKSATFLFEDNQRDNEGGHEVTSGVVFSTYRNIFLFGKEVSACQPRLFWLQTGIFAADEDDRRGPQHIQIMTGYCFEGYARYPNPDRIPRGCFFSTIGLKKIRSSEVAELVTHEAGADNLTEWSDQWIMCARNALIGKAEIRDDIDLPVSSEIVQHFIKTPYWIDSFY